MGVLRILHLTKDIAFLGGAEIFLRRVLPALAASEIKNFVCNLCSATSSVRVVTGLEEPTLNFPGRTFDLAQMRPLLRFIRDHRIDLIHTHLYLGDLVGAAVRIFCGLPLISTKYSLFPTSPSPKTDSEISRAFFSVPTELSLSHYPDRIIAASDAIRNSYIKTGVSKAKIVTHRTFHLSLSDVHALYRGSKQRQREYQTVLTLSRLTHEKGIADLLLAAKFVSKNVPGVRFTVIGSGPCERDLRSKSRALGLAGVVTFAGGLTHEAGLSALRESDLFVLPSHQEGIPLSIQEAMAAGVPVVATKVGGVPELIPSAAYGRLVPAGAPLCLAEAIIALLDSPRTRKRTAKRAFSRVCSFTVEKSAAGLLCEYRRALKALKLAYDHPHSSAFG